MKSRWVFTSSEIARLRAKDSGFQPTAYDEFIVAVLQYEVAVIVQRDGTVTNRWADGTVGVPSWPAEMANEAEAYCSEELGEIADIWLDVEVGEAGGLVQVLDPIPAAA